MQKSNESRIQNIECVSFFIEKELDKYVLFYIIEGKEPNFLNMKGQNYEKK
jgi:hypothetical protein